MLRLKKLIESSACGVSVEINAHRGDYETANQCFRDDTRVLGGLREVPKDVRQKMIETDTIIEVTFYPHTPTGFHCVYHYDLDAALDLAVALLDD